MKYFEDTFLRTVNIEGKLEIEECSRRHRIESPPFTEDFFRFYVFCTPKEIIGTASTTLSHSHNCHHDSVVLQYYHLGLYSPIFAIETISFAISSPCCEILNMRYFFCFVLILLRCQLAFQFSAIRTSLGNIEVQTTDQISCYNKKNSGRNFEDSSIIYIIKLYCILLLCISRDSRDSNI